MLVAVPVATRSTFASSGLVILARIGAPAGLSSRNLGSLWTTVHFKSTSVHMPKSIYATVRTTIYVLPETLERIRAAAGRRPLGHAVDDAFADRFVNVAKPYVGPPRVPKYPSAAGAAIATIPHPIACECEACTLTRLNSPQTRKK